MPRRRKNASRKAVPDGPPLDEPLFSPLEAVPEEPVAPAAAVEPAPEALKAKPAAALEKAAAAPVAARATFAALALAVAISAASTAGWSGGAWLDRQYSRLPPNDAAHRRAAWYISQVALHGSSQLLLFIATLIPPDLRSAQGAVSRRSIHADVGAMRAGWPRLLVSWMHTFQHLNTVVQLIAVVYLVARLDLLTINWNRGLTATTRTLLFSVGSAEATGWHALLRHSPSATLRAPWTVLAREDFPRDEGVALAFARSLTTRWPRRGSAHRFLLPYFMMAQVRHLALPLLPWVDAYLYPEPPYFSLRAELVQVLVFALGYIGWAVALCWRARGVPPYPVLAAVSREGRAFGFHFAFLVLAASFCVASYAARGGDVATAIEFPDADFFHLYGLPDPMAWGLATAKALRAGWRAGRY